MTMTKRVLYNNVGTIGKHRPSKCAGLRSSMDVMRGSLVLQQEFEGMVSTVDDGGNYSRLGLVIVMDFVGRDHD